jgi:tRNA (uracil-5-)-methyltransferase TRM9
VQSFNIKYFGLDISEGLIKEAQKYHPDLNLVCGSAIKTPYESNFFDCVVSFAVLHHIPSREYRERFFKESYRLLEKDGFLILTVWNIWKTKEDKINNFFKENIDSDLGDLIMDFSQHKKMRYVYGFKKEELEDLAKKAGFLNVRIETVTRKSKLGEEENFLLIAQK